jgi:transposase
MKIVGCDLRARQQSIAMGDTETGVLTEKVLKHEGNAVREFYAALEGPVVVGMEATGAMQWFLELLEELGIQCRVGHPAKIRAAETRKQKHDRRDAEVILELLLMKDHFPEIGMPSTEQRDLRTLLRDRHQWVKIRTRLQHTLQAIALNHALREGRALWTAAGRRSLQDLSLPHYTAQRRDELLSLYTQLDERIQPLDKQVETEARQRLPARRLLTHPGVGPVTALATEVFLGDPHRFAGANRVASYIGMIPCEHSSGKRQRLGKLSKEGNSLLRYLWIEATLHAPVKDPELKRFYRRKLVQNGMGKARVATARKLGIGYGSCCGMRLTTKSSTGVESCRRRGKPLRECLITTVVLREP